MLRGREYSSSHRLAKPAAGSEFILAGHHSTVALKSNGLKPKHHAILQGIPKVPLTARSYTVNWRATADDGHHQKGSWTFKVS